MLFPDKCCLHLQCFLKCLMKLFVHFYGFFNHSILRKLSGNTRTKFNYFVNFFLGKLILTVMVTLTITFYIFLNKTRYCSINGHTAFLAISPRHQHRTVRVGNVRYRSATDDTGWHRHRNLLGPGPV